MNQYETLAWLLYQDRVREIEEQVRLHRLLDREDEPATWQRATEQGSLGGRAVSRPINRGTSAEPA